MRNMSVIVSLFIIFMTAKSMPAQFDDPVPAHGNEYGAGITIAMSGFGLGGFYRFAFPSYFHLGAHLDFYIMRDEKEFSGYDVFGFPVQINKFNRLFLVPVSVELKKRFFQNDIEENFRPYVVTSGGVTFGMNFPRNNDIEFSNLPPEEQERLPRDNEYQLTFNLALGIGIDVTSNENFFISIRPQYRFFYFPRTIAGQKNHSNFEIRIEFGKRLVNQNN
jgi:hypothetical protein